MKRFFYCLLIIATFIFFGCATLFTSSTQKIKFESEPQGAQVYISGQLVGITPLELEVKKNHMPSMVEFKKEGFEDKSHPIAHGSGLGWPLTDAILAPVTIFAATMSIGGIIDNPQANTLGDKIDAGPSSSGWLILAGGLAFFPLAIDAWTGAWNQFYSHTVGVVLCNTESKNQALAKLQAKLRIGMKTQEVYKLLGSCNSSEQYGEGEFNRVPIPYNISSTTFSKSNKKLALVNAPPGKYVLTTRILVDGFYIDTVETSWGGKVLGMADGAGFTGTIKISGGYKLVFKYDHLESWILESP